MNDHQRYANEQLAEAMREHGLGQTELAEELNRVIGEFTGKTGTITDRHVRRWLTGHSVWPHERQRIALKAVLGRPARDLGFTPRTAKAQEVEPPVYRRHFLTSAAAVTADTLTAGPASGSARYTLGMTDVQRMSDQFDTVVNEDDSRGGTVNLEARASTLATTTLDMMSSGSASQRVRGYFYSLAASFTSSAMWAAMDGQHGSDALRHMERALSLAGYAQDSAALWRAWSHGSLLALRRNRPADAVAASEASRACAVVRTDPLFASLTHARTAVIRARLGDKSGALRGLDRATDMLDRAEPDRPRPRWMAFYDRAELAGLASVALMDVGRPTDAEAQAHRALALMRPDLQRNRTLYTVKLARSQAAQGDIPMACATATTVLVDDVPLSGRIRKDLVSFHAEVSRIAPDAPEVRALTEELRQTTASEE